MAAQNPAHHANALFDTWSLVRSLFAREQHHLQHIARLEKALSDSGSRNHRERTAYNSLQLQYDQLNRAYTMLYDQHERLKHELALKSYFEFEERRSYTTAEVEEIA